jgi:predicted RNA-binding protein with PUA-like domain
MKYWLVKSEPFKYSWDQFVADGITHWDGVRNYAARNNMREMAIGEKALYYHSNEGLAIVGIAEITKAAYQDPTTDDTNWVVVDLKPVQAIPKPVTLATLKADPFFASMDLIRLGRLSVGRVTPDEYERILQLGGLQ